MNIRFSPASEFPGAPASGSHPAAASSQTASPSGAAAGNFTPISGARADVIERFLGKVARPNENGCTLWTAKRGKRGGYGAFTLDGGPHQAHRVAWTLFRGKIPDGMWVLHKCDVPACVNPSHLFLGTHQDNMDDMQRKGRRLSGVRLRFVLPRGQNSRLAKLSEADAIEIIRRRSAGELFRNLAAQFAVSMGTISSLVYGHSWSHLSRPSDLRKNRGLK